MFRKIAHRKDPTHVTKMVPKSVVQIGSARSAIVPKLTILCVIEAMVNESVKQTISVKNVMCFVKIVMMTMDTINATKTVEQKNVFLIGRDHFAHAIKLKILSATNQEIAHVKKTTTDQIVPTSVNPATVI